MATFFCPDCWKEIEPNQKECPHCGFVMAAYDELSFEQKLLTALNHPVYERRIIAVQILGVMQSIKALPYFDEILFRQNTDYYLARTILEAVEKIDHPDSLTILERSTHHHIELICELALEILALKSQK